MNKRVKKLLAWFLTLVIALSLFTTASAALPPLKTGVRFGDALKAVKQKIKLDLQNQTDTNLTYFGMLDGKFVNLIYDFDEGMKGLTTISVEYIDVDDPASASKWYKKQEEELTKEFGEPLNNPPGTTYDVITSELESSIQYQKAAEATDVVTFDLLGYNEWVADYGKHKVKVDLISSHVDSSESDGQPLDFTTVCYHAFTEDAKSKADSNLTVTKAFEWTNGITFGDKVKTVIEKETENDDRTLKKEKNRLVYTDTSYGYTTFHLESYDFAAKTGGLYQIDIDHSSMHEEVANKWYDEQLEKLTKEYGEPLGLTGGNTYEITGSALQSVGFYTQLSNYAGKTKKKVDIGYEVIDYNEWVVDYGEYKVKIELVLSNMLGQLYRTEVSYTCFTN